MKSLKKAIVTLLVIVLSFSFLGCVTGLGGRGNTNKIKFLHIWPEHETAMNELIKQFMIDNQGIEVEIQTSAHNVVDDVLRNAYIGGDVPDVFFQWTHYMYKWVPDGLPMDITDICSEVSSEYFDGGVCFDSGKVNNKLYNLPFRSTGFVIAYNKTMFEDKAWKIPDSLEKFEKLLNQIKAESSVTPLGVYGGTAGTMMQLNTAFNVFGSIQSGMIEDPSYKTGRLEPDLTDDLGAKALVKTKDWLNKGYFGSSAMGLTRENVQQHFMARESAMCLVNNNEVGMYIDGMEGNDKVGVFAIPAPEAIKDSARYVYGGFDGFSIYSGTRKKEASVKLLKYLVSEKAQQIFTDMTKSIMVNKDVKYKDAETAEVANQMQYVGRYDVSVDFNGGTYTQSNGTLSVDYLNGNTTKTAQEIIRQQIINTEKAMKDTILNPPSGVKWIKPTYIKKDFDKSWLNTGLN